MKFQLTDIPIVLDLSSNSIEILGVEYSLDEKGQKAWEKLLHSRLYGVQIRPKYLSKHSKSLGKTTKTTGQFPTVKTSAAILGWEKRKRSRQRKGLCLYNCNRKHMPNKYLCVFHHAAKVEAVRKGHKVSHESPSS